MSLTFNRKTVVIAVLLIVGFAVRLIALDRIPLPVQQDELSDIYDGYSIAETGSDRAGTHYPMVVRGFGDGDYRPALYAWLAAVPAKFVGFSIVGGRLPSAVLGCVVLVLVLSSATSLGGDAFGIAALALAALSPWLVSFSRVAHGGGMLPAFFIALFVFLWERSYSRSFALRWLVALGFAIGISTSAYQSTRLTAPLIAACVAASILMHGGRRLRALSAFVAATFVGALPQIAAMFADPGHFFARSRDTLAKAPSAAALVATVVHNAALNVGPRYLFVPDMTETYMTSARLLPVEIVLFYPGLICLGLLRGERIRQFRPWLYAMLVISILPAALANQNPHSLRASGLAALTPFFSAATLIYFRERFASAVRRLRAFDVVAGAALLGSAALVAFIYIRSPTARSERMQPEITMAAERIAPLVGQFTNIYFENGAYQPYLYVVAMTGMTPEQYQSAPKTVGPGLGHMDAVSRVGKFYFLDSASFENQARVSDSAGSHDLFVGRERLAGAASVDSVRSVWHTYYIMELNQHSQ